MLAGRHRPGGRANAGLFGRHGQSGVFGVGLGGTLGFGGPEEDPYCEVCKKHFATLALYDTHLAGHTHKAALCRMCPGGLQLGGGLHPSMTEKIEKLLTPVQMRVHDE